MQHKTADIFYRKRLEETVHRSSKKNASGDFANRRSSKSKKFWQHRNIAIHAEDADSEESLTVSLNNTIHGQFDRGPDTMPQKLTRHLFRGNIHALLRKSTGLKRQWLSHIIEARERQLRIEGADADSATLALERQLLQNWLALNSHRRKFRRNNHRPPT